LRVTGSPECAKRERWAMEGAVGPTNLSGNYPRTGQAGAGQA
jgi:hypothetical protein